MIRDVPDFFGELRKAGRAIVNYAIGAVQPLKTCRLHGDDGFDCRAVKSTALHDAGDLGVACAIDHQYPIDTLTPGA